MLFAVIFESLQTLHLAKAGCRGQPRFKAKQPNIFVKMYSHTATPSNRK